MSRFDDSAGFVSSLRIRGVSGSPQWRLLSAEVGDNFCWTASKTDPPSRTRRRHSKGLYWVFGLAPVA